MTERRDTSYGRLYSPEPLELSILRYLADGEPSATWRISVAVGINMPATRRLLKHMAVHGLVSKIHDGSGRIRGWLITEAGRAHLCSLDVAADHNGQEGG